METAVPREEEREEREGAHTGHRDWGLAEELEPAH